MVRSSPGFLVLWAASQSGVVGLALDEAELGVGRLGQSERRRQHPKEERSLARLASVMDRNPHLFRHPWDL
jgi:hypothetical protein